MNTFGRSMLTYVKSNHLVISYEGSDVSDSNIKHILNVSHYSSAQLQSEFIYMYSVSIFCSNMSNINIWLSQITFIYNKYALEIYCDDCKSYNSITLHRCKFMIMNVYYDINAEIASLIYGEFNSSTSTAFKHNELNFITCYFSNITLISKLLEVSIEVDTDKEINNTVEVQVAVVIIDSIFQYIEADYGIAIKSSNGHRPFLSYVLIQNTNFSHVSTLTRVFEVTQLNLIIEGPIIFSYITSMEQIILHEVSTAHNYIEFSNCQADTAIFASRIYIKEYTSINFTLNAFTFSVIQQTLSDVHSVILNRIMPRMLTHVIKPCIFQFTSAKGSLDYKFEQGERLNYSISFIRNVVSQISEEYVTSHCSWDNNTAFSNSITDPKEVKKKIISYVNNTIKGERTRLLCVCNTSQDYDCNIDELGPFYPGETVLFKFFPTFKLFNKTKIKNVPIRIEDNLEVECKSENGSNIVQLSINQCQEFKYILQHKSGKRCEVMFKFGYINPETERLFNVTSANVYSVTFNYCPKGFTFKNLTGTCDCDPILYSYNNLIIGCDINDQTVLRSGNSWIFADSSSTGGEQQLKYHVSLHCPYDYCLPHSSHLNLSNPDSQCQFKRTGLLCGQCKQGLSTVFGSSQCKLCSNDNFSIILPVVVVAGIALVTLLIIFKLTVANGYANMFIFYANIISINASLLFPVKPSLPFVLISLTNLDLGVQICFYDGMTDYVKLWLQLAFPVYIILISLTLMVVGRYFTTLQRLTIQRFVPVLATLILLSYTKVLRTVCNVLFLYSTITYLPSKHTKTLWSVDTNVTLFGIEFTILFVVCILFFLFLFLFTVSVVCTRPFSRFRFFNHFRPLLNVYKVPYEEKFHYWPGLQLVMRTVFIALSALDKNANLFIGSLLIGTLIVLHGIFQPQKNKVSNVQDILLLFNLQGIYIVANSCTEYDRVIILVLISVAFFQFLCMFLYHGRQYFLTKICYCKWFKRYQH